MFIEITYKSERVVLEILEDELRLAKTPEIRIKLMEHYPRMDNIENTIYNKFKLYPRPDSDL